MSKKPVALIIMDGFGYNAEDYGNAITAANTPNIDKYMQGPNTLIGASGLDVGLPDGQMGNSEVGHTNIGAGRIVYQMLVKISKDIKDGTFFNNKAILSAMENCKEKNSALHLMGLLSPGGVHSHMEHLYGIVEMAKKNGLDKVYIHAFLDGRDVPPSSAADYMAEAVAELDKIGLGKIATISGRFYAMDRDNAWDRVEKAYSAMVYGEGVNETNPVQAIKNSYANDATDEFMLPTVIEGGASIKADDSVIFFNFRPDRARQITRAFVDPEFKGFERKNGFFTTTFVCMAQYDAEMPNVLVAFPPEELTMTFGEYLAKNNKTQLRLAETQKYAHVTFFFNGGEEKQFEGEDRILVNSPKVATFDMQPEMSAYEVADKYNLYRTVRAGAVFYSCAMGRSPFNGRAVDFHLEHFGLTNTPGQKDVQKGHRARKYLRKNYKTTDENIFSGLKPEGIANLNDFVEIVPSIYYFSFPFNAVEYDEKKKKEIASKTDLPLMHLTGFLLLHNSRQKGVNKSGGNDGMVDVVAAFSPPDEPRVEYTSGMEYNSGIWHVMPVQTGDHGTAIGLLADKDETHTFYLNIMKLLKKVESKE